MGKSQTKRFFHQDQTCEFDKLFIIWLFPSVLRAGNQPVGIVVEHYGKALQESNALTIGQSEHVLYRHKHKPYKKGVYYACTLCTNLHNKKEKN